MILRRPPLLPRLRLLPLRRLPPLLLPVRASCAAAVGVGVGGGVAIGGEPRRVGVGRLVRGREGGELLVKGAAAAAEVVAQQLGLLARLVSRVGIVSTWCGVVWCATV